MAILGEDCEEKAQEAWISVMPKVFNLATKEGLTREAVSTLLSRQRTEVQSYSEEQGELHVRLYIRTHVHMCRRVICWCDPVLAAVLT